MVILGVAFLENSGDVRNSPVFVLVEDLQMFQTYTVLHDPYVAEIHGISVIKDLNQAVTGTDAVIIVTKHREYIDLDWQAVAKKMNVHPILIDGRNVLSRITAEEAGFVCQGVGELAQFQVNIQVVSIF